MKILPILTSLLILLTTIRAEEKPSVAPKKKIEVCFVLDTTGSMSGLIEGAKQKIWSIANELANAKPMPDIRLALIGYRDKGDDYITRQTVLTDDLDSIYAKLQPFSAGGGGDTPESVNQALKEAVSDIKWSTDGDTLRIIFLVGDAPPHMDYDEEKYPAICQKAAKLGIIINSIQCGAMSETIPVWKDIATLSEGKYIALEQSGGMVAIATPYDKDIAKLSGDIGGTSIAYGSVALQNEVSSKISSAASAPVAAQADRASYSSKAGGKAIQGEGDLLDALKEGKAELSKIKNKDLPADLQKLSPQELESEVTRRSEKRATYSKELAGLVSKRDAWLKNENKKRAETNQGDSFDQKVAETIRQQAAKKNILYPSK